MDGRQRITSLVNIMQWQDSGRGYGNVIFMGVNNQSLKHIQFSLGSVRVHIIDSTTDDPNFTPQRTGSNVGEYAIRTGNPLWNIFGNTTVKLPWALQLSGNFNASGGSRYNITTGFDNNGDGNLNDRPFYASTGTPVCSADIDTQCAYSTQCGLLSTTGTGGSVQRNAGIMPWTFYLDINLQRTFGLTHNANAEHPQALVANIRSSNVLNHLNVTAVGGSSELTSVRPVVLRRQWPSPEGGRRYSF